jgi:hypothetical protein
MYTVLLVVPEPLPGVCLDGIRDTVRILMTLSLEDAGLLFNGSAGAEIVAIRAMKGAREFVRDIKSRFPTVQFIGLAENSEERLQLCDCHCCCVTPQSHLPETFSAILEKRWRFDPKVSVTQ